MRTIKSAVNLLSRLNGNKRIEILAKRFSSTNYDNESSQTGTNGIPGKMKGWQIHEYGGVEILQCSENIKIPTIQSPTEVLVEVHASSVNPIDVRMMGGYGATILNSLRCNNNIEFPLTLGRDFCGKVVRRGMGVRNKIQIGDMVWGVVPLHKSGCHAEYVLVDQYCVSPKPNNLDVTEAAGILYTGLTAWSGLFFTGHLGGACGALTSQGGGNGKRLCILGASGGVGGIATQIGKAENVEVIATCSPDAIELVKNLGADQVIDYTQSDAIDKLRTSGPYDIILDCAGLGCEYASRIPWKFDQYITFSSPALKNFDSHGLGAGLFKNIVNMIEDNVEAVMKHRGLPKWAFFVPAPQGIEYLRRLAERGKLTTVIDGVYDFDSNIEAYQKVLDGHLRGKVIIKMK